MKRVLPIAIVAALALPAMAGASSAPTLPHGAPIAVFASLEPLIILWGDTVEARITVLVDRDRVAVESLRVRASYAPFSRVGTRSRPLRRDIGKLTQLTFRFALRCLTYPCVSRGLDHPPQSFRLAPGHVLYELRRQPGKLHSVIFRRSPIEIDSRIAPSRYVSPFFCYVCRGTTYAYRLVPPQSVTYRASPRLLAGIGFGLAAAFALIAALCGWRWWRAMHPARRESAARLPLDLALAHLDWARQHGTELQKRKALGRVAAELDGAREIAGAAEELAWAEPPPPPPAIEALADRARGEGRA